MGPDGVERLTSLLQRLALVRKHGQALILHSPDLVEGTRIALDRAALIG